MKISINKIKLLLLACFIGGCGAHLLQKNGMLQTKQLHQKDSPLISLIRESQPQLDPNCDSYWTNKKEAYRQLGLRGAKSGVSPLRMLQSQTEMLDQIVKYLENELRNDLQNNISKEEIQDREKVIEYFKNSPGECAGLSFLWAYAKKLQDSGKRKECDDLFYLLDVSNALMNWNEKEEISRFDKQNIDRFISNLLLTQEKGKILFDNCLNQLDFQTYVEDTKRGALGLGFEAIVVTDKEGMRWRLNQVVKPGNLVFIGAHDIYINKGHLMALYQEEDHTVSLFNPSKGELNKKQIDEVVDNVWEDLKIISQEMSFVSSAARLDRGQDFLKELHFRVFQFNEDGKNIYPSTQAFRTSGDEFITIIDRKDIGYPYTFRSSQGRKALRMLQDPEVIEVLERYKFKNNTQKSIVWAIVNQGAYDRTPMLVNYMYHFCKDALEKLYQENFLSSDDMRELNKHRKAFDRLSFFLYNQAPTKITDAIVSKAIELKKYLSLADALIVLKENLGNDSLAKELLEKCDNLNPSQEDPLTGTLFVAALERNLQIGNLETAKTIVKSVYDNLKISLTQSEVFNLRNPALASFIYDNMRCCYWTPRFNKMLGMENKIQYHNMLDEKNALVEKILHITDVSRGESSEMRELTRQVCKFKNYLKLNEVIQVLYLNIGNIELAKDLIENCSRKECFIIYSVYQGLLETNIDFGCIDTAAFIAKAIYDRFGLYLEAKRIVEIGSPQLAKFLLDNGIGKYDANGKELLFSMKKNIFHEMSSY